MPFQGNPNAGAPNVELLRFLADQKATRAKLAFEQQKAQIEAMRQAKEDARAEAKFQIEMANAMETQRQQRIKTAQDMQGLLGSIGSRAEAVPAGQRQEAQSQQFFGSVGDGDQQLGQDFAAAVLPNDPNAFNEELALASTLTGDRNLDRDVSQAAALGGISRADVLGGAQTELNVRDLAAKRELDKTTAAEQRQEDKERRARNESAAIAQAQTRLEDTLRDENIVTDAASKALGQLDAVSTLQAQRNDLKKTAARLKRAGEDTTDLDEKMRVIGGMISSIQNPNTVRNVSPIPFESKAKLVQDFRGADFALSSVGQLFDAFESGSVQSGLTGKIINFRAVASNLVNQALAQDTQFANSEVGQELQRLGGADPGIDLSKQLTLGLEQIALAYAFSRMGRGNARFTIKEMQEISKQLGLTSLTATPDSIRGALVQVADAAIREKNTAFFLLGDDPEFRDQLSGLSNLPEDEALLNRMKGVRQSGPPKVPARGQPQRQEQPGQAPIIDPRTLRPEDLMNLFPE